MWTTGVLLVLTHCHMFSYSSSTKTTKTCRSCDDLPMVFSSHRWIRCSVAPSRWPTAQRRWWRNAKPAMSSAGTPGGRPGVVKKQGHGAWNFWNPDGVWSKNGRKGGRTWWFWHVLTLDLGYLGVFRIPYIHPKPCWLLGASRSRLGLGNRSDANLATVPSRTASGELALLYNCPRAASVTAKDGDGTSPIVRYWHSTGKNMVNYCFVWWDLDAPMLEFRN